MSEKSRDAEPEREEIAAGGADADAVDPQPDEVAEELSVEVDETIAELEQDFTPEEQLEAAAPIKRKTATAPVRKKDRATPKRKDALDDHDDPYRAKNPVEFAKQSGAELKKVVWPTWPQTVAMFTAVLIFVIIMIAIVGVLDLVFGWSLLQLLGS